MKKLILSLLAAVGIIGSASASVLTGDLTNGLVAYYGFKGNAIDAVGGYNGTIIGDLISTSDRYGNTSSAYYFDNAPDNWGHQSYIDLGSSIPINSDFSINMWFSLGATQPGKSYALISKRGDDNLWASGAWQFYLHTYDPDSLVSWGGTENGIMNEATIYNSTYTLNEWYMATFTRSGNNYKSYINGNLVSSFNGYVVNNDKSITIGAIYSGAQNYSLPGSIDDIGFWNSSLTSTQVSQLYALQSVPEPSTYALFGIGTLALVIAYRRKVA
jgi:hypothetical protein